MFESTKLNLAAYTPVCDITVMSLCMIMFILLHTTFIQKNTKFHSVLMIIVTIWTSSATNIIYEMLLYAQTPKPLLIYIFRIIHHVILIFVPYLYIQYLHEPFWIKHSSQKVYNIMTATLIIAVILFDVIGTVFKFGFYITDNGIIHNIMNPYIIVYALFTATIFYMIYKHRGQIIRQLYFGLLSVNIISVLIFIIQGMFNQVVFTSLSCFLPVIGFVFMFHSNPYDVKMGAVSGNMLESALNDYIEKKEPFSLMSCNIMDFSKAIQQSQELKFAFYKFMRNNVKRGVIYRFPNERMVLVMSMNKITNYDKTVENMTEDFRQCYKDFKIDYKIIGMKSSESITNGSDYIKLIDFIEQNMPFNEIHSVNDDDIEKFYSSRYILGQLEDIVMKKDLNDERVLVYCQPVFNILTGQYDTAEALMRLKLDKTGLVFPDKFIPIAEQYSMIHTLSMIILNKTCCAIRDFLEDGYELNRISVNFSALDIRYDSFCQEVQNIIDRNGIPYDKIAVEITESRSEADFNLMKQRVTQLQRLGIKFYLDDFGTGYSNFERIMEIPFDIIKFDRSMLIESVKNDSSKFMVSTFANMFNQLNYAILFEGVENEYDESQCISMDAKYLQGYKYSKPIPIEKLTDFLQRHTHVESA